MTEINKNIVKIMGGSGLSYDKMSKITGIASNESDKYPQNPLDPTNLFGEGVEHTCYQKIEKDLPSVIKDYLPHVKRPRDKRALEDYYSKMDMALLGILTVISGALPNVHFLYRGKFYLACMMTIIIAIAGAGKGIIGAIFHLINPINKLMQSRYEEKLKAYNEQQSLLASMTTNERKGYKEEILEKPSHLFFWIPTDCTYAAFAKALVNSNGYGEVNDTELDSMLTSFKQDMGDYSVLLRKNFEHEVHKYYRKTEDEFGLIDPRFSVCMTCTINQSKVMVDPEAFQNGEGSRFNIYLNSIKPKWEDAWDETDVEEDDKSFYMRKGQDLLRLYTKLEKLETPVRFYLTKKQLDKFNKNFSVFHMSYIALEGYELHASILRFATTFQRIAMVLTVARIIGKSDEEQNKILKGKLICSDKDFNTAMTIIKTLMLHSAAYYELVTNKEAEDKDSVVDNVDMGRSAYSEVLASFPAGKNITRAEIMEALIAKGIPESTASKTITRLMKAFLIRKVSRGMYVKCTDEEYLIKKKAADNAKKAAKAKKRAEKRNAKKK